MLRMSTIILRLMVWWKFAGLKPTVRWNEHDFEKVFKGSYVHLSKTDYGSDGSDKSM